MSIELRIALVEDDPGEADEISAWLGEAGFAARVFRNTDGFLRAVATESYDLVILDCAAEDSPGLDSIPRYRAIADGEPPVMVVADRDHENDVAAALESGADDYLHKPLRHQEFVARIRAVGRRMAQHSLDDLEPFAIDERTRRTTLRGQLVALTAREFELALFFFQRRDWLLSRNHILESIWGDDRLLISRTVDTHISRLRKKLELDGSSGWRLVSVYRRGYCLKKLI